MSDTQKIRQLALSETSKGERDQKGVSVVKAISDNNLEYKLPSEASVTIQRNLRKFYFQKTNYRPNENAVIDLQTGAFFVNAAQSYLVFEMKVTGGPANLGIGSGFNVIRDVVITSRSGTQISSFEGANIIRPQLDNYMEPDNWKASNGQIMGYPTGETPTTFALNETKRFVIPLRKLSPFFDIGAKLHPSFIMSGLRIQLVLESAAVALNGADASYEISNAEIACDCHMLTDGMQRVMSRVSAANGLELVWEELDRNPVNDSKNSTQHIEVRKAVSRALSAYGITRTTTDVNSATADSLRPQVHDLTSFQARVGTLQYPQAPLLNKEEMYFNTLAAFDSAKHTFKDNAVTFTKFNEDANMFAVDLERSQVLALQAIPLNNSRSLSFELKYGSVVNERSTDVWVRSIKIARVYLQNVVLKH